MHDHITISTRTVEVVHLGRADSTNPPSCIMQMVRVTQFFKLVTIQPPIAMSEHTSKRPDMRASVQHAKPYTTCM